MLDTVPSRDYRTRAPQIAVAHELEPALVCAVIEQESALESVGRALRAAFLSRYVAPLYTAGKLSATEAYTRADVVGLDGR